MKAPQDCTGVNLKFERKKSKKKKKGKDGEEDDDDEIHGNGSLRRSSTDSLTEPRVMAKPSLGDKALASPQRSSSLSTSQPGQVRHISAAPPPAKYISPKIAASTTTSSGGAQKAKALFKYDATSAEELSVKASDILTVVEPDDGSGWILAKIGRDQGLVPASYVEIQTSDAPKKGPPVAPRRGGKRTEEPKKKYLRAIYDYDAGSELELTLHEGDMVTLVSEDKGDGWTEVEMKGKIGSVPSNYVEVVNKP